MPPRAPRTVVAPPRNNAYVGMLGLAVFGMALGCLLLGLELSGYDPVPAFQPVSLPKVEARPAPPAGGTPASPAAPGGSARAEPTPPAAPVAIAPLPTVTPPPSVATVDPPKVETPKPEVPRGPRPGFNLAVPQPPQQ